MLLKKFNFVNFKKTRKSKPASKSLFKNKKPIAKKNRFVYFNSPELKIFFNRKKLWLLSSYFSFLSKKKNSFFQIFNFGAHSGLNSNKIGFWLFKTNSLVWRQSGDTSLSSIYYKPMRGSWKKNYKKKYLLKNFLPLLGFSSLNSTFHSQKFLLSKRLNFKNVFNNNFFRKFKMTRFLPIRRFKRKKKVLTPFASSSNIGSKTFNISTKLQKNIFSKNSFMLLKKLNLNHKREFVSKTENTFNNDLFLNDNSPALFNRFFDTNPQKNFDEESLFLREFIYKKKIIRGLVVQDKNDNKKNFIKSSTKFYYYNYRNDPLAGSYFIEKVISVFASRCNKKIIRKSFYKLFFDINSEFSVEMLYSVIISLKPEYINVKVRRGREHYEAPILASESKAILKSIKFFKKAVMARRYENSFYEKLRGELYDFFCWNGYKNVYYEDYVSVSKKNMHLRHFRSVNKY